MKYCDGPKTDIHILDNIWLLQAKRKLNKAGRALAKVQEYLQPAELPSDQEMVTDEERFLLRKMGLSMKPFLLLGKHWHFCIWSINVTQSGIKLINVYMFSTIGRRDVFDGTIQNMHLHWKFRELVKIIVKGKSFSQVKHIAISLEAESGGVFISIDKTTKGYAIIVYRGKNYQKPLHYRPRNLLTRRQALARSIELQRREVSISWLLWSIHPFSWSNWLLKKILFVFISSALCFYHRHWNITYRI